MWLKRFINEGYIMKKLQSKIDLPFQFEWENSFDLTEKNLFMIYIHLSIMREQFNLAIILRFAVSPINRGFSTLMSRLLRYLWLKWKKNFNMLRYYSIVWEIHRNDLSKIILNYKYHSRNYNLFIILLCLSMEPSTKRDSSLTIKRSVNYRNNYL